MSYYVDIDISTAVDCVECGSEADRCELESFSYIGFLIGRARENLRGLRLLVPS